MELLVLTMTLLVIGALAAVLATDSRDGNDWVVHPRP
jgi:hypothetical protein